MKNRGWAPTLTHASHRARVILDAQFCSMERRELQRQIDAHAAFHREQADGLRATAIELERQDVPGDAIAQLNNQADAHALAAIECAEHGAHN